MVSQSTRGENTVEELGHDNLCDRPPVCPAATTAWGRGQFTPLLPQWESPPPTPVPASLHTAFQCKGCGLGHMLRPYPDLLEKPQQWVSRFFNICLEFAPVSYGDFSYGEFPKCKQGFWKLASIRHIIFMPSSKQIFCSEVENLSVEVQEYSPSQVKALSEVCVPPSC